MVVGGTPSVTFTARRDRRDFGEALLRLNTHELIPAKSLGMLSSNLQGFKSFRINTCRKWGEG